MQVRRPPTIRDVAAAAGVSTAAVSKYINGQQRFSPEVEGRIRDAIAALGYRQNPLARSMVTGETRTVGFAVLNISNPYYIALAKGAHTVAAAAGYTQIVVDAQQDKQADPRILEALSWRVDGILVSARLPYEAIDWLARQGKPVIVFGHSAHPGVPSVSADPHRTAYIMGRHLIEIGRKRIAYVGDPNARWNAERFGGFREALAEAGLEPIVHAAPAATLEGGEAVGAEVLRDAARPDAVVGANDLIALGLLRAAHALGVRVPDDVAFAGFDDIAFTRYAYPPLTTVDTRSEEVGRVAMGRLLAAIRGESEEGAVTIEPRLIPRESTRGNAAG
jgi:DNA-binding LacI/PurR family transcriptional regulator